MRPMIALSLALAGLVAPARAAEFPTFQAAGDRPARRQRLLRGDDGRRRRRRQARRRGRDRGRGRLVRQPVAGTKHTIIKGATERDNVCIQPHDIDGDGKVDFALGRRLAADQHRRPAARSSGSAADRRRRPALAGHPDRLRADAAPDPLGRRAGHGQEAARRRPAPGPRDEGAELGRGAGGPRPGLHRPRRPGEGPLAGRGRRRLAAHDPQPPAHRLRRRRPGRDRRRRLGGGLRARRATRAGTGRRRSSARATRRRRRPRGRARSRSAASPTAAATSPRSSPGTGSRSSSTRRRASGRRPLGPPGHRRAGAVGPRRLVRRPRRRRRRGDRSSASATRARTRTASRPAPASSSTTPKAGLDAPWPSPGT